MKASNILTIISSIMTFLLILFLTRRVINTLCFDWLDYAIVFGTLLGNLGINIISTLGK